MKKYPFCLILMLTFGILWNLDAQTDPIRSQRKNAISLEAGFKSLSGVGINYSRYVSSQFAVDLGAGFGTQLLRWGVRGRYFFTEKNLTPYVGFGFVLLPLQLDNLQLEEPSGTAIVDINRTVNGLVNLGLEWVSSPGISLGINLGYQVPVTNPYNIISSSSSDTEAALRLIYGRGISFAGNFGYAF